ncbi:DUF998 domain-containing protein [Streptomyces puniciscabiei]
MPVSGRRADGRGVNARRRSLAVTQTHRMAVVAVVLSGALLYAAWVAESVLSTGLAPHRAYISELAAHGQPYAELFRTTDLAAGTLVGAGAVAATLLLRPLSRSAFVGWLGLAVFGIATVIDSRFPLSCAPSVDPVCLERQSAGLLPVTDTIHNVSSIIAVCSLLVAMTGVTLWAHRPPQRLLLARVGPYLVSIEVAAIVWNMAAIVVAVPGQGIAQRFHVGVASVWLSVFALSLNGKPMKNRLREDSPPS